ncbi:MAG: CRTAC1 family protein [Planctomycetales bacterium]|nr:CRTAC1 family protein [Planctomycetales bacterium]
MTRKSARPQQIRFNGSFESVIVFSCDKRTWVVVASMLCFGCTKLDSPDSQQQNASLLKTPAANIASPSSVESPVGPLRFLEVSKTAGVRFRNHSPLTKQRHVHRVLGSGIGWFDLDCDDWPELYCCQGTSIADSSLNESHSNALFHNLSSGTFSDITRNAGLFDTSYSMGIASADYDNDGFADLCLTGYQVNTLLHNNGDGTFSRVEIPQGTSPGRLSASCSWGDIDADGNLDLYITNYAKLGPEKYPICTHTAGDKTVYIACHPNQLESMPDMLYRNSGAGEFVEISTVAGIAEDMGRQGLGVVAADFDQDGDTDFYVANDTTPNYLWENHGHGRFSDRGPDSGTSTNRYGAREAGMGVAVGDVDGNGQFDLFVTNFYDETNTLYRNEGNLLFEDVTNEMGLGAPSRLRLAFGVSIADFDNDGWLDLLTANGHIHDRLPEIGRNGSFAQLAQVFYNERGIHFRDVSDVSGPYFREPQVGRGTAVADYDRDGDADVAINQLNSDTALLQNKTPGLGHSLQIELVGIASNRDGIGATLQIDLGDRVLLRTVQAGGSYLSCDERPVLIGMGELDRVRELTVTWTGGRRESWSDLIATGLLRLVEGSGSENNEL